MEKSNEINYEELARFASLHFSLKEIALIMELDEKFLEKEFRNQKSAIYRTIRGAQLKTEAEIREATIRLAVNGSTQGIQSALALIEKNKLKNVK